MEIALYRRKIKFVRLDGSLSHRARSQAIQTFKTDLSVPVFLISLKAGGVGLNLTEANHVFLCDPWWNPAIEQQAIDRVHRLGQTKPVTVTRYVVAETIEEKILQLHEKKKQLAQGALGEHRQQLAKLNMKDLELLFSN